MTHDERKTPLPPNARQSCKIYCYAAFSSVSCAHPGGWSFGTQKFKDLSSTRYARQTFIYSAIPYLRDRNFDGLDIDWEYPKGGDDKKNYVLLLKGKDDSFKGQQT